MARSPRQLWVGKAFPGNGRRRETWGLPGHPYPPREEGWDMWVSNLINVRQLLVVQGYPNQPGSPGYPFSILVLGSLPELAGPQEWGSRVT